MRTKTLLIAAAALVAGVISSEAQTVYSANVVGYYNVVVPAHQYYILANQLINGSDVNQTNNDINVVFNNGFVSDPNGPPSGTNAQCLIWVGNGYSTLYYLNTADAISYNGSGSTAGWVDNGGNPISGVSIPQGSSAFILNPSSRAMTNTIVGTVLQGTNKLAIGFGHNYNLLALANPVSTNADANLIGLTGLTSDPNGPPNGTNDQLLLWVGNGYATSYYLNQADAIAYNGSGSTAGFVDNGGNPVGNSQNLTVGQGFFLLHFGPAVNYTNTFNVQ